MCGRYGRLDHAVDSLLCCVSERLFPGALCAASAAVVGSDAGEAVLR
jgi:hypothetical protein